MLKKLLFCAALIAFAQFSILELFGTRIIVPGPSYPTIQSAIQAAREDPEIDLIIVEVPPNESVPYTYKEILDFSSIKNLTMQSKEGKGSIILESKTKGPIIVGYFNTHDITIDGFVLRNSTEGIIFAKGASNIAIKNCSIQSISKYGIRLDNVFSITIKDSLIENCTNNAIYIKASLGIIISNCIIRNSGEAINIAGDSKAVIKDTTITRIKGAGIFLSPSRGKRPNAYISNCKISQCSNGIVGMGTGIRAKIINCRISDIKSRGIFCWGMSAYIKDTDIADCGAEGIYINGTCAVKIINSTISGCGADAAVVCAGSAKTQLINCVIYSNNNDGISVFYAQTKIINCVIANNKGDGINSKGDRYLGKAETDVLNSIIVKNKKAGIRTVGEYNTFKIEYCNVWKNKESNYSDCQPGKGCIPAGRPLKGINPGFKNPSNNNYRLIETSPCIDAGAGIDYNPDIPLFDINGYKRPAGQGIDIGAYEYIETR